MHLNRTELKVLSILEEGSAETSEQLASRIAESISVTEKAIDHLIGVNFITGLGIILKPWRYSVIHITAEGREFLRTKEHDKKAKLYKFLDKLFWSVVIPILVSGATAYYITWLGKK